ncbi:DUF5050 domain-containing protein [Psychrobacillus sp.]|uniref:DUF5050 domain-containing protein n=1 Tax=Psychrobacillus sp. TaxID=1871623 RepID=UPI0028BD3710|nr:DUF5050 domain-containing protein [Psychrobacillus sp.]
MKQITKLAIAITLILSIFPIQSFAKEVSTIAILSNEKQKAYNSIVESLLKVEASAKFNPDEVNYMEISDLVNKAVDNNPSIFYYASVNTSSDGTINFKYNDDTQTILDKKKKIDVEVDRIIKTTIKKDMSDLEKVKQIHDYLVMTIAYDTRTKDLPKESYGVEGALFNKTAVCDGYTKSMQLLLNKVGVETLFVAGTSKGVNHSWNLVKVDGEYYHVDATWNDPVPNKPNVNYNYFLMTNEQLKKDHQWNEKDYLIAKSNKFSYFHLMEKMIEKDGAYYYTNGKDELLYKMDKKSSKVSKVTNDKVPYFAIHGQWIYYSNYSKSGYLYKMKLDGKGKSQINSIHVQDLVVKGSTLHYKDNKSNKNRTLVLK